MVVDRCRNAQSTPSEMLNTVIFGVILKIWMGEDRVGEIAQMNITHV